MTHQYAKPVRKKLRKLAGLAYKRELSRAQENDLLVCRAVKLGFLSKKHILQKTPSIQINTPYNKGLQL